MSVVTCSKCENLFLPTTDTIARDPARLCPSCTATAKLLAVVDELVKWHGAVDVVSGTVAADQLRGIVDRAALAAHEARAL